MKEQKFHFDTLALMGNEKRNIYKALSEPIVMSSTFEFDRVAVVDEAMGAEGDDFVYTRGNNPTLRCFEGLIAELEGGRGAVAFGSGMGAISAVLVSLLKREETVVLHKTVYGSTTSLVEKVFPDFGIRHKSVDLSDFDKYQDWLDPSVRVIYFETPSNPNLKLLDIRRICEIAKNNGVKVVVDNTFASPYIQNPLEHGVDVVVHSSTKFLCGHGDALGGVAVSNDLDYLMELRFKYMCNFGSVMSPFNAWLTIRGIKTLGLRMRQMQASAMKIAAFLAENPLIDRVNYPGLPDFPDHDLVAKQMKGPGSILSFQMKGGVDAVERFIDETRLIKTAVSVGDCHSLIEWPMKMTHKGHTEEELEAMDVAPNLVRISTGLEDVRDLIADIQGALKRITN